MEKFDGWGGDYQAVNLNNLSDQDRSEYDTLTEIGNAVAWDACKEITKRLRQLETKARTQRRHHKIVK